MTSRDAGFELDRQAVERLQGASERLRAELGRVIVGQEAVIDQILITLVAGGHCLLTGTPGLAKTLLVKSVAQAFALRFQRIQFTPDLMPSDIIGTEILQETPQGRRLSFVRGPVFANIILADEINRTPPKTQAALLEAMQEHQVTAGGTTHRLEPPFFVLATQNPLEMEGTYPLPEAQLDRFMLNVTVDHLSEDEEVRVVLQTTRDEPAALRSLFNGEEMLSFQRVVRSVPIAEEVGRYAVRLAASSRPHRGRSHSFVDEWVTWGAGPRAAQALVLGAKARAILAGRFHASYDDVRALAAAALRHRILLNYRAQAEAVTIESLIGRLIESVRED